MKPDREIVLLLREILVQLMLMSFTLGCPIPSEEDIEKMNEEMDEDDFYEDYSN